MNTVKNLLIVAVLAAVGYGVYVSLQRNSEVSQGGSASQGSFPGLTVELPTGNSTASPGLALGGRTELPTNPAGLGGNSPVAAPSANPLVAVPGNPLAPPSTGRAMPYESSAPVLPSYSTPTQPTAPGIATAASLPTGNVLAAGSAASQPRPSDVVQNLGPPPDVLASAATPPASSKVDNGFQAKLNAFLAQVNKALAEGKLAEAHLALSTLYCSNPDLSPDQAEKLNDLLGKLAGTVIYSQQSFLEKPYMVQPGDTLDRVAKQYGMSWQFLGKINNLLPPKGICDENDKDRPLPAGTSLKVVRGPFDALINLGRHELTLLLRDPSGADRYAGRFTIGVGHDQPNLEGDYVVRDMTLNPAYYGPDGVNVQAGDPRNPLGAAWIGLTDRIGIHGTNNPQNIGRDGSPGSICVGEGDIQDLCGLLSVGSRVKIVRSSGPDEQGYRQASGERFSR